MTSLESTPVFATTTSTPDGDFSIVATEEAILASGWTADISSLNALIHASLRPELAAISFITPGAPISQKAVLGRATRALEAFYDGDFTFIGQVPVQQKSGPFREHAWDVLRTVKPGEVVTYSEYAERSGRPAAVRAAASACAMNAAALFVPCHRVLRTDGSLGGFRYGLPIKESLLTRERH